VGGRAVPDPSSPQIPAAEILDAVSEHVFFEAPEVVAADEALQDDPEDEIAAETPADTFDAVAADTPAQTAETPEAAPAETPADTPAASDPPNEEGAV
jgi:hypothetical protein